MYCNQCGTLNPNNSQYCMRCGNTLNMPNQNTFQQNHQNFPQGNQQWNNMNQSYPSRPAPKKKKKGCGCFSILGILLIAIIGVLVLMPDNSYSSDELMAELSVETYITAELYKDATIQTMELLHSGPNEVDYNTWQTKANEVIELWKLTEEWSVIMDQTADEVIANGTVSEASIQSILNSFTSYGLTTQDVNLIYDNAPKGQKLKTLAKHLNVSAREALTILTATNEQLAANWNNTADTYQTLENSARVVKDVSKATVFVGSLVATGGASGLLDAGIIAVTGTDLVVEIAQDSAIIQYGEDSRQAKSIGRLRGYTEPVASVIGLTGLKGLLQGKNIQALAKELASLSGAERKAKLLKLGLSELEFSGAVLMTIDQTAAYIQENKVLGINLDDAKKAEKSGENTIKATVMTKDEAKQQNITTDFIDRTNQPISPLVTDNNVPPNDTPVVDSIADPLNDEELLASNITGTWVPYGIAESKGNGAWFDIDQIQSNTSEILQIFDGSGNYRTEYSYENVKLEYTNDEEREIQQGILDFQKKIDKTREVTGTYLYKETQIKKNQTWRVNGREEQGDLKIVYFQVSFRANNLDENSMQLKETLTLFDDKWLISQVTGNVYVKK